MKELAFYKHLICIAHKTDNNSNLLRARTEVSAGAGRRWDALRLRSRMLSDPTSRARTGGGLGEGVKSNMFAEVFRFFRLGLSL